MSVPNIKVPPGTPRFQLEGHAFEQLPMYGRVKFTVGSSRSRRVSSAPQYIYDVSWFLSAAQLAAIDNWYRYILRAGERQFAAEVLYADGYTVWYTARWLTFEITMKTKNRGRLVGRVFMSGEPEFNEPSGVDLTLSTGAALRDVRSIVTLPTDLSLSVGADLLEDYA